MPIRKSNDTLFYLIGIIPVIWLALLLAQSLGGGLPELLRKFRKQHPEIKVDVRRPFQSCRTVRLSAAPAAYYHP